MKKILITNDDGFQSEGILALIEALRPLGEVIVVAPSTEKSACGHSLTLNRTLKFVEVDYNFYKLEDGTPSDCIYVALCTLFKEDALPDLVVSGINIGSNMGEDITYSGTAGAAMEAVLQKVPAIAISQVYKNNPESINKYGYKLAQKYIYDISKKILEGKFPLQRRRFLNINIPPIEEQACKGLKVTHVGQKSYDNKACFHENPRGETHHWIGAHTLEWEQNSNRSCDLSAIEDNYVSISPIKLDMSAYEEMDNLNAWIDG